MNRKCIHDLPEEVFEFILSFLSPYNDLKNCMLVCRSWNKSVRRAVKRMQHEFIKAVSEMHIDWYHLTPDPGPTITKRYSHSACCQGTSMYVFGGCTSTSTTFNDLWRLDLASRRWIRPLSMGTYPSPKACATMVSYRDMLILFGGWTHPSPYPLHQAWRIFNQLHVYNPEENRWNQIIILDNPPPMAGHSATIHGDKMVVFGGLQKQSNGRPFASSNDVWVLNLTTMTWKKQQTGDVMPSARYGQSQLAFDDTHALVIGGCGGPNMLYSDVWLLSMDFDSDGAWQWKELQIKKQENAAPYLLCHPACKVGDKMVILSRRVPSKVAITVYGGQLLRPTAIRTWTPPHETSIDSDHSKLQKNRNGTDTCVNGKRGTLRKPQQLHTLSVCESRVEVSANEDNIPFAPTKYLKMESDAEAADDKIFLDISASNMSASNSGGGEHSTFRDISEPSTSSAGMSGAVRCNADKESPSELPEQHRVQRNTHHPSIRPNPMKNRQRQLEGLQRMEDRIRAWSQKSNNENKQGSGPPVAENSVAESCSAPNSSRLGPTRNPLTMYIADLSQVLADGTISWLPQHCQDVTRGPEEAILYSLVEGRGELIMFGGIHKDLGMSNTAPYPRNNVPETVSNTVHFITAQKLVI